MDASDEGPTGLGDRPPYGTRRGARTTHRRGRMTDAKRATVERLAPQWMIDPPELTDLLETSSAVRMLDIGVGNGTATLDWATRHPDALAVAVELHQPGIVALLQALEDGRTPDVRVLEADVEKVMEAMEEGSVDHVRVLFPDPWPKKRHVKRRLVNTAFVARVAELLTPGGTLHLATDWVDYADQMRAALAAEPSLDPLVDVDDGPAVDGSGEAVDAPSRWRTERPHRPVTAYEQRGLDAGRQITDLVAIRR